MLANKTEEMLRGTDGVKEFNAYREKSPRDVIQISRANLGGLDLTGVNFSGLNLQSSNLTRATLENANLKGASFRGAHLDDCKMDSCFAEGADFYNANLYGADLEKANLRGASLQQASLTRAFLSDADLEGTDLREAKLRGAILEGTEIISFCGGQHFAFAHKSPVYPGSGVIVKIGCCCFLWEHWARNYGEIGRENNYSERHIRIYGAWITEILPAAFPGLKFEV